MRDVFLLKEIWVFKKCDSVNWQNNFLLKKKNLSQVTIPGVFEERLQSWPNNKRLIESNDTVKYLL